MVEDWLANAYKDMSRRQFLARMSATGINLAGFALASNSVAGEVVATSTQGLITADGKVMSESFQVPLYEARPSAAGKYPVLLVIPEIFGMHEHIKDVTRRFAKEGFLSITFEIFDSRMRLPRILPTSMRADTLNEELPQAFVKTCSSASMRNSTSLPQTMIERPGFRP